MSSIASTGAAASARRLRKCRASSIAARSPTKRIPRPKTSRRSSRELAGLDRLEQVAGAQRLALLGLGREERRQVLEAERVEVGEVLDQPALHQLVDQHVPEPLDVHRLAAREVLEPLLDLRGARGVRAAPVHLALGPAHGRAAGRARLGRRPGHGRRRAACPRRRSTTFGITSPPRSISTVSPTRTSLRAISSSLWSVARLTVVPARNTGSRCATGVSLPVRPTYTSIACTSVAACSAGYL